MLVSPPRRTALRTRLLDWWDAGHRVLPWRAPQGGADPYRVWVAEVMLQQTQVSVVVPYYRRFLGRFPTLDALARADEEDVLALWSGLGYYARARRMREAAQQALALHGGLPASLAALSSLPGFGRYTAGAVASIAFALPAACVDGNAARVLSRLFLVEGAPHSAAARERLWRIAEELVPAERPGDFNQALMELGATACAKRSPSCARCPLAALCQARRAGRQQDVPPSRRARPRAELDVACAVVRRGGALLMARRARDGLFGGLWELPSAVVAPGDDARAALRREVEASLGLSIFPGAALASVERVLTHRALRLTAYACRAGTVPAGLALVRPGEQDGRAMATAMRRLVAAVMSGRAARAGSPARSPRLVRAKNLAPEAPSATLRRHETGTGRNPLTR